MYRVPPEAMRPKPKPEAKHLKHHRYIYHPETFQAGEPIPKTLELLNATLPCFECTPDTRIVSLTH